MPAPFAIPEHGHDREELLRDLAEMRKSDADWKDGRTFSLVYYAGDAHDELLKRAHATFFSENALNPMAFKSLKRMEAEIVRMTATMLHGDDKTCGTLTSGGTESLLLAVKAARDRAKKRRPWIRRPEMVVPRSIHVAFEKAAHYFGVVPRYAPLGRDQRADVAAMAKLINRNTVLVAASAPQYPHGVVDPIEEIAAIAKEKKIPMHVDACIGGFVLPWVEKLGYAVPRWDFRVPGVTSISADLHKYGYAAKGASVILYRGMEYLKHQFFVSTQWPGGIYASPSMPGTRPGGTIAAAWAAMMALGQDGYVEHTRKAMAATERLKEGVRGIPGLAIVGEPHATIVAIVSRDPSVDIYAVADRLEDGGWSTDRQQSPPSIHCTVTSNHLAHIGAYVEDLRAAVAYVRAHPEVKSRGNAAMYGMIARIPFRGMIRQGVMRVMESMYGPDASDFDAGAATRESRLMSRVMGVIDKLDAMKGVFTRTRG